MLKALDDLEKAVSRLVEKAGSRAPDGSISGGAGVPVDEGITSGAARRPDRINEEAAELIRRALKRLRSL